MMQPPPRGCVLKLKAENQNYIVEQAQPPPRGCVLKPLGSPRLGT